MEKISSLMVNVCIGISDKGNLKKPVPIQGNDEGIFHTSASMRVFLRAPFITKCQANTLLEIHFSSFKFQA